jgi:hypothetical protein
MPSNSNLSKGSKTLPVQIKPSGSNHADINGRNKPMSIPLSPAQQVKVVNRLINFFETK